MNARLVLGIDIGSSAAKAVLGDELGNTLARARVPQDIARPRPGAAEQDPATWWTALRRLVAETVGTLDSSSRGRLAGVAISAHVPTLLLADAKARPLGPAMLYGDQRADAFVEEAATLGGESLAGDEWLPKLLWLRRHDPDRLSATRFAFVPHEYLAFRLTGERGLDYRTARRTGGLLDPEGLAWRADLAREVGLEPAALPPLRRGGEILGTVAPEAAAETGLPLGTRVVVGLGDTPAELVGAGVVHPGEVLVYYGTTTTIDVCSHDTEAFLRDPRPIAAWAPYHEVGYAVIGPALAWIARNLEPPPERGDELVDEIRALDGLAAAIAPSLDPPYVVPNFLAHARSGHPVRRPAIVGLDANHTRAHLHRAVLESFGFVARAGLEEEGVDPARATLVAAGGGATSTLWRQLVSDVLGARQVFRPAAEAARGSAALAAWATCGAPIFDPDGWGRGAESPTDPDPAAVDVADRRFATWLRIRDATAAAVGS